MLCVCWFCYVGECLRPLPLLQLSGWHHLTDMYVLRVALLIPLPCDCFVPL